LTKKIGLGLGLASCDLGLGLAVLVLFCETRSCNARRHNDFEGHSNFLSTINSVSILCLEHHYRGDQQWRSHTEKLNMRSAFVYFRWSWSCHFGLGLVSSGLGLGLVILVLVLLLWSWYWS